MPGHRARTRPRPTRARCAEDNHSVTIPLFCVHTRATVTCDAWGRTQVPPSHMLRSDHRQCQQRHQPVSTALFAVRALWPARRGACRRRGSPGSYDGPFVIWRQRLICTWLCTRLRGGRRGGKAGIGGGCARGVGHEPIRRREPVSQRGTVGGGAHWMRPKTAAPKGGRGSGRAVVFLAQGRRTRGAGTGFAGADCGAETGSPSSTSSSSSITPLP